MERRTLAALVLLTQCCVRASAVSALHDTPQPADSVIAHLLSPVIEHELEFARRQLYAVSALLPNVQLRAGAPPVACSCAKFTAGTCFAAGCHPCEPACGAPPAQGPLRPGRGPLGTGLLCAAGGCEACCRDPAQSPNATCALPPGGCPE